MFKHNKNGKGMQQLLDRDEQKLKPEAAQQFVTEVASECCEQKRLLPKHGKQTQPVFNQAKSCGCDPH